MTTFGDQVREFGGVPVGGSRYAGWWGNDVWFVDDQDGLDSNTGKAPDKAKGTIQAAIDAAGPQDTIFLRPRNIGAGRYHEHGYYTGTLIIPAAKYGLSIIGTGAGMRGPGANIQCGIEGDAAATTATIQVNTPCFNLENAMVKQINESTVGAINATTTFGTVQAWGLTVSNCMFKDFQDVGDGVATIILRSAHWATVQHCFFREADRAISLYSTEAAIRGTTIRDCDFWGEPGEITQDIYIEDCKNLLIDNCKFLHAQPSGGAPNRYIVGVGTSSVGIISNCYFAMDTVTVGDCITIADALSPVHCWGEGGTQLT